jgi:hypothetical protein
MPLLATKKAIFAKAETTYGTAVNTIATDAILVSNLEVQPFEGDLVDRNLVKPYFGNSDVLVANARTKVSFSIELAGTGTVGAVPHYGPLLRACAMSQTIVTNTAGEGSPSNAKVIYRPVSEGIASATIRCNYDGVLHTVRGCRGNVKLQCEVGQIPMLMFEMEGIYVPAIDSSYLDFTTGVNFSGIAQPLVFSNASTTGFRFHSKSGVQLAPDMSQVEVDFGNSVIYRELVGDTKEVLITDRKSSGSLTIDAVTMATKDYFAAAAANDTGILTFTHGIVAGNRVKFTAERTNISSVSYAENDNVLQYNIPFTLLPDRHDMTNTGDREFTLEVF